MWDAIQMLFLYVAGHSLADTTLQPSEMGKGKSRHNSIDMSRVPVGQKPLNLWVMWLTHHALIQGLVVTLLTLMITFDTILAINLGIIEFVSHWIIDFLKCENWYSPYADQFLHILMKIFYITIIFLRF